VIVPHVHLAHSAAADVTDDPDVADGCADEAHAGTLRELPRTSLSYLSCSGADRARS
jgi:hypothetical protein